MLRKGVIGVTVGFGLVALLLGAFATFYWPEFQRRNAALIAHVVETGLADFLEEQEQYPEGEPPVIVAALLGENPRAKSYLRPEFRQFLDPSGQVLDPWKRPFRFDRAEGGGVKLRSAGPNGTFGDADDLGSAYLQEQATD